MRLLSLIVSTAVIGTTVFGSAASAMPNHTNKIKRETEHKYTLCHATNAATNPYVKITVDYNSIVKNAGHDIHNGPVATSEQKAQELKSQKVSWGDIIPVIPEHNYAGQNVTADGMAVLDNDCEMPTVTNSDTHQEKENKKEEADKDCKPAPAVKPTGGSGSASTPEQKSIDQPEVTVVKTETPVAPDTSAPVTEKVAVVATMLPETGANAPASLFLTAAGLAAAALAYATRYLRKKFFA